MRMVVINLDRSVQRLEYFRARNAHLPQVERFSAVDGAKLDLADLRAKAILTGEVPYTIGSYGVSMSHLSLWQQIGTGDQPVTVLEDDAVLSKEFATEAAQFITMLPANWDIVLWGWNFDSYITIELIPGVSNSILQFDQETMRRQLDAYQNQRIWPRPFRLMRAFGVPGYTISASGARRLMQLCLPIRPLSVYFPGLNRHLPNTSLDIMMAEMYPQILAFAALPPLLVTENRHDISTVQTGLYPNGTRKEGLASMPPAG